MKRMRIGLRGLLVIVAIFAAFLAVAGYYYRKEQAIRMEYVHAALQQHMAMRAKLKTFAPGNTPQKAAQLASEIAKLDSEISSLQSELETFRKK